MHCTTTSYGYGGRAAQTLCSTLPNTGLNLTTVAVVSVLCIVVGYAAMTYKGKNARSN